MLDAQTPDAKPVRLAIAGLVHGHVSGFLRAAKPRKDVEIVGVFDPDAALTASYAKANGFAPEILFQDLANDARPASIPKPSPPSPAPAIMPWWWKPARRATSP